MLHLHTNTVGPVLTAQKVLKHGLAVDLITFISSDSGSAQCFREMEDGFAAYAASKAALNQMIRHMAAELKRKGSRTAILALHPGEVQTDMANIDVGWDVGGQMSPAESISSCLSVIESKGMKDNGTFWTWENKVILLTPGYDRYVLIHEAISMVSLSPQVILSKLGPSWWRTRQKSARSWPQADSP